MASIIDLIDSYDRNSKEFELLMHDLLVNSDVPFESNQVDAIQSKIVSSINSRIDVASTRYSGLVLLDKILSRCSKDTYLKYASFWINKVIELLEDVHSTTQESTLACKILGFLLEYCKEIPELHQLISKHSIKRLLLVVNEFLKSKKCGAIYYLIAVMVHHYPEVCEWSQDLIRDIILQQIDSTQENLVNSSAKCYVLLSRATERSFMPLSTRPIYTRWTYNQALLCNSLHVIMDELFYGLIELKTVDIWDHLELPPINEDNIIQYYNEQKQRFLNICIYLSSMLRGYDVKNSVVPQDILDVLCRGLAITPLTLKDKDTVGKQMLHIILPKLHIGLLTVLDAFISGFAQELIPFGKQILSLFQQTLNWTSTYVENHLTFTSMKSFKSVKLATYKCLSSWLMHTNSVSGIETIANECLTFIMKDITPEPDRILLTVHKRQHWSKRVIKRFKDSQYENSTILNKEQTTSKNESLDADLCKEALVTLQNILHSGTISLKRVFHMNVQNTVIPLLHHFYLSNSVPSFYKDHNKCRLELFKVLRALQMNPHVSLSPPTQDYLEISHKATYDIDLSIAQEARLALSELEKIIHPIAPTLQLPRQSEPDNELLLENRVEEFVDVAATTALNSDKRSRFEQEFQETVAFLPACKRPKTTIPEYTETVQNRSDTESIEINYSQMNEPQADKDLHENVRNLLQETHKIHCDKEQDLCNSDKCINVNNVNTEIGGMEYESDALVIAEDSEQHEEPQDPPSEDETHEMLERNYPPITEKVQKKISEIEVCQEEEESDANNPKLCNMFIDISDDIDVESE